ncbi:MAG: hypothetical protein RRA94_15290 [Bacteroidota bacterium]|nr:hypothetical protein [Bacteroidota bacterium]
MRRSILPAAILLFIITRQLGAQCSDAGTCVIGGAPVESRHQLSLRYVYGSSGGDDALTFHTVQFDGVLDLIEGGALILRLPYRSIDGPLGSASGVGDLTLLWRQQIWTEFGSNLSLQVGGKFATGAVNEEGLPQAYQPGLGTNDVIVGLSYETAPWIFAAGYQLSTGRSDNEVDRLARGDDLFARAGYRTFIDDVNLGLEVIAIQRLAEDNIRHPVIDDGEFFIDVPDSDQLQVNILGSSSYEIDERISLLGQVAVPLLQRDVNIDGLKRALTVSVGVQVGI